MEPVRLVMAEQHYIALLQEIQKFIIRVANPDVTGQVYSPVLIHIVPGMLMRSSHPFSGDRIYVPRMCGEFSDGDVLVQKGETAIF